MKSPIFYFLVHSAAPDISCILSPHNTTNPKRQRGTALLPLPSLTGPAGKDGQPGGYTQAATELALFDLDSDVGETKNVAAEHPDIIARLQELAEAAREDLGDAHQKKIGKNRRPAGKLAE